MTVTRKPPGDMKKGHLFCRIPGNDVRTPGDERNELAALPGPPGIGTHLHALRASESGPRVPVASRGRGTRHRPCGPRACSAPTVRRTAFRPYIAGNSQRTQASAALSRRRDNQCSTGVRTTVSCVAFPRPLTLASRWPPESTADNVISAAGKESPATWSGHQEDCPAGETCERVPAIVMTKDGPVRGRQRDRRALFVPAPEKKAGNRPARCRPYADPVDIQIADGGHHDVMHASHGPPERPTRRR
jgi:hypothetical protein